MNQVESTMANASTYREEIEGLGDEATAEYLVAEAGLPEGRVDPRLVNAGAQAAGVHLFHEWVRLGAGEVPENHPREVLVMTGVVGFGRLVAAGEHRHLGTLRSMASDPRWRVRSAVAIALKHVGRADPETFFDELEDWASEGPFVQRAVVAALADPPILEDPEHVRWALDLLDEITDALHRAETHDDEGLIALRKALGFAWVVVMAADPSLGRPRFEAWLAVDDPNVRWVLRENLEQPEAEALDDDWVEQTAARL